MAVRWVDRVPTKANRVLVTPEDGSTPYYATITRVDEPSVVGTPVNAANLNAMQDANGLSANKTVYVTTTGSDATGDGSQAVPYATVSKALSTIPRNLNGFIGIVNIGAGIYSENVSIRDYGNGILRITGNAGESVTFPELIISNVTFAEITNISLNLTGSYLNAVGANIRINAPFSASGGAYGIHASYFANLVFGETVTINNTTNYAVVSTAGSRIFINALSGQGNPVAFRARDGSTISFNSDTSTVTNSKYLTDTGGRIYTGSQTNTPVN